ncbi:regulator of protease activity HflC (stomatin/prohibitin superfamily) [Kitasatospora sp. MAA4]|uniref:SPFH domain-containing protein n=1 Tax=Kitasatospora sp. MAA4 TaxID=3035093 RepID=UPI002473F076|nr:SPFH domain-containing protein [Kitasatospora sp. MAA4]MDH6132829.1 regulator of protease activity HflC (stomatin/prohibitin superfamily) [Kitasatospora sp. MAA4]
MEAPTHSPRRTPVGATPIPKALPPAPDVTPTPTPVAGPRGAGAQYPHPVDARAEIAARRPPRADPDLREREAVALPGWIALLALLLGLASIVLVTARVGLIPHFTDAVPDLRSPEVLAAGGPVVTGRALAAVTATGLACLIALAGLLTNAGGETRVLSRWGRYRGTVRRSGLLWINPLLRRRLVDVRLRHWRSEPVQVTDRTGTPIVVRLLVVWRIKDTARALFAVADHEDYLREQIHAVLTRTASMLPCDSNAGPGPALRDGQWFADELTRALAAEAAPAGLEVYSVQPQALDYAPEVAESMRRRRLADLDAGLRTVLVDDAVEAAALAVRRLERATTHELDDAARSALMEQLLVAFVAPAGVPSAMSSAMPGTVPAPAARATTKNPARKEGNRA